MMNKEIVNKIIFKSIDFINIPMYLIGWVYYMFIETPFFNGRIRGHIYFTNLVHQAHPPQQEPDEHEDIDKQ